MAEPLNIGFLLFPRLTQLDLTGPHEVLSRLPGAAVRLVWKTLEPVRADSGIAVLPDYLVADASDLVRILPQATMPELDCYLVYAEEMKNVARVQSFRDFLVANAQRWGY